MGESRTGRAARLTAAGAAALAVAALLTSCAQLGLPTGPSAGAGPVQAPAAEVPADSPTPVVASPDPVAPATPTPTASAADGRAAVVPFITAAAAAGSTLQVQAIVPGVVEGTGRCTATATNGTLTRTVEGAAVAASSYTGCEPLTVTGVTAGTWQVRVRYASDAAVGASAARTVTSG